MNDQTTTACSDTNIAQQGASTAQHGATSAQQSASPAQQSATVVAPLDSTATPDAIEASIHPDDSARNNGSANLLRLTEAQELALEQLIAGRRDSDVAKVLKVHRGTVYRWRTRHPRFIAELSYRAQAARLESSLNAQAAIDLATQLVLKRLRSKPRRSMRLAMRLLSSARIAHLATPRHRPLRQVLTEIRETRHLDPAPVPNPEQPISSPQSPINETPHPVISIENRKSEIENPDSLLLSELAAEIAAPLPTPPATEAKPKRSAPLRPSTIQKAQANRSPRRDLLDAMSLYPNLFPPDYAGIIARRPDLAPLDIHYTTHSAPISRDYLTPSCWLTKARPVGIDSRLDIYTIEKLADKGLIQQIAGHSLADYESVRYGLEIHLRPRTTGEPIILNELWRDDIL